MNTKAFLLLLQLLTLSALPLFAEDPEPWEFEVGVSGYFLPDDGFANSVFSADRGPLHLEARYNYEDMETGSMFAGYSFQTGDSFELVFTPMIGAVLGNSYGFAPGFHFDFSYGKLSFASEGEYLFSLDERESNFFYSWSELSYAPVEWFWFGAVGQRTRAFESDLELERGPLAGFGWGNIAITGYWMNPGTDDDYGIVIIGYSF